MSELDRTLQSMAENGASAVELMGYFRDEMGERFSQFSFVNHFFRVFDIDLLSLRRAAAWKGFSQDGIYTDVDVNAFLGQLRSRGYHQPS